MMRLKHKAPCGKVYELNLYKSKYSDSNGIAIYATTKVNDVEKPWGMITTDLKHRTLDKNEGAIDIYNNGENIVLELVHEGFCVVHEGVRAIKAYLSFYPVVEFTDEFIKQLKEIV